MSRTVDGATNSSDGGPDAMIEKNSETNDTSAGVKRMDAMGRGGRKRTELEDPIYISRNRNDDDQ